MSQHETHLGLLCIVDESPDIKESTKKDAEALRAYCERVGAKFFLKEKTEITKYRDIAEPLAPFSRAIVWYTGHGMNLEQTVTKPQDNFPCFLGGTNGNKIYIEGFKVLEKLKNPVLRVVAFDCCNMALSKPETPLEFKVKENAATLFDFRGKMILASSKRNQMSFCRGSHGSDFTMTFLENFFRTYENTLMLIRMNISSHAISSGTLQYEKYVAEEEEDIKAVVIEEYKMQTEEEAVVRHILQGGIRTYVPPRSIFDDEDGRKRRRVDETE